MNGDYTLEDSIYILFTTRAFATGIPGTLSASTVAVYEDVTATPIETSIAVTESLNSIAGLNAVTIAALAASGYNAGGHYHVVIEAGTVDSVSIVGEVVGHFTIASSAAAVDLANGTDGLGAIKAETALIVADTNELQTDDIPTLIATLDAVVDTVKAETALIVADTNELQTDDIPTLISTLDAVVDTVKAETVLILADTTLIVADTNELQTDDVPGLIATAQADLDIITGADGVTIASAEDLTATMKTSVNAEVDTALDTALPAAPTLGSINDVLDRQEEITVQGTASGVPTTTTVISDISITADDQFNGRIMTFRKDTTTANLRGQQTDITASTAADNSFTVTALTTAPVSGDVFEIT